MPLTCKTNMVALNAGRDITCRNQRAPSTFSPNKAGFLPAVSACMWMENYSSIIGTTRNLFLRRPVEGKLFLFAVVLEKFSPRLRVNRLRRFVLRRLSGESLDFAIGKQWFTANAILSEQRDFDGRAVEALASHTAAEPEQRVIALSLRNLRRNGLRTLSLRTIKNFLQ